MHDPTDESMLKFGICNNKPCRSVDDVENGGVTTGVVMQPCLAGLQVSAGRKASVKLP